MAVRRAVTLLVVSVLVPGAAQLTAGNRAVGRLLLRVWLGLVVAAFVLTGLWFVDQQAVLALVTNPLVLTLGAGLCLLGALAWPAVLIDAWRLGRPGLLPRRARIAVAGLTAVLVLLTAYPLAAAGRRAWAAADLINGVFGAGRTSAAVDGRYTVLLLGGDAGPDRVGTRPDSVNLASIDSVTGRTVLFSLPRNLENVPFAPGSPAAKALPKGWSCGDTCLLNAVYTWGSEHKSLFPGVADPGAEAMKEAVEGVTGLPVNYYVLIDLQGFAQLINAMGGVQVTVRARVPIGGGTSKVSGYIQPGTQRLDGYHALWFARSRHGSSDYERMARQRCVMDAMARQMDPATLLRNFQDIAAASKSVVSTDLPAGELATFIGLGQKAKSQRITSVQFVPPLITPAYPDYGVLRRAVQAALAASRSTAGTGSTAGSTAASRAGSTAGSTAGTKAGAAPSPTTSTAGAVDVRSVCAAG